MKITGQVICVAAFSVFNEHYIPNKKHRQNTNKSDFVKLKLQVLIDKFTDLLVFL